MLEVLILGNSASMPAYQRNPSAQLLHTDFGLLLIDCGEGTQMQLKRYKVKLLKIKAIFISHLHGDHYLGIFGLLSTMSLTGRKIPLHLYAPVELADIIRLQHKVSQTVLNYPLLFFPTNTDQPAQIFENDSMTIHTVPLRHRIACAGFLFKEKPKKHKIHIELFKEKPTTPQILQLKNGQSVVDEQGNVLYAVEKYTTQPPHFSYAYISDTIYDETLADQLNSIDVLYHETTFLHEDHIKAQETFHTTAQQAAQLAKTAKVGSLLMGHYSSRYQDLTLLLQEAQAVFPNSRLSEQGKRYRIGDAQEIIEKAGENSP